MRRLAWVPAAAVIATGLVLCLRGWGDFDGYAIAGRSLRGGIYSHGLENTWPPAFSLFAAALAWLQPLGAAGRFIWAALNLAAFAHACVRVWRVLAPDARWWVAPLAAFVAAPFVSQHLVFHQVYMLLFALAVEGFFAAREGAPLRAGIALGLAGALKVTPALALPYFFFRRDYKLCAAAVGTALLCSLALAIPLGARGAVDGHLYWLDRAAHLRGTHGIRNQSIQALVERWSTGEAKREQAGIDPVIPLMGPDVDRVGKALSWALLLFACWRLRRADPLVAAATLLPIAVLAAPYAWRSQYVALALVLALAVRWLSQKPDWLDWLLLAPFLLAMPLREPSLAGLHRFNFLEGVGLTCILALLLLAGSLRRRGLATAG